MKELLVEIFLFLSPNSIVYNGSLVSKEWYEVLKNEYLWENYYLRLFQPPNYYIYSFKREYIKRMKSFFQCQICKRGDKFERKSLEIIIPCECNKFYHNSCLIKHNLRGCKFCKKNYEFKVLFNFKTVSYIANYIIVLGSAQVILLSIPLFFKNGLKRLGNICLVLLICYSIYSYRGLRHLASTLLLSYYLYVNNAKNGSLGIIVMYSIQNIMFLKMKKYLDFFWLENIFKTVNKSEKDLFLL